MGPTLIFDKSVLQGLNPDESAFLESYYLSVLTPLFFIETLADLEKQISRSGRTPEDVVGSIAYKTPELNLYPSVHHKALIAAELSGRESIELGRRPYVSRGQPVKMGGGVGVHFKESPEAEALHRWQKHEFMEVERLMARRWRDELSGEHYEAEYQVFRTSLSLGALPRSLSDSMEAARNLLDRNDPETVLKWGMELHGVASDRRGSVIERLRKSDKPELRSFAPYFRHVLEVDAFFFVAIAADLISRFRTSNKVDLAYLYYLPFCMVFTSSDNLHRKVAPLFITEGQTFVDGVDFKADLGRLDGHFSKLPDHVKEQGLSALTRYPPADPSFLVTRLWDQFLPSWRDQQAQAAPTSQEEKVRVAATLEQWRREAVPLEDGSTVALGDAKHVMFERSVSLRRGKWRRFSPEIEKKP